MTYTVNWNQWYHCGPDGDDSDFEEMVVSFETEEEAENFVEDLVSGKALGAFDRTVHRNEIVIR